MIKMLKRVILLALAVLVVILIHNRVQQEAEEAKNAAAAPEETGTLDLEDTQSMSVIRLGDGVTLGIMEENTERGGVNVTVRMEDGSEAIYSFTDVTMDDWYARAVNFVVSAGLMTGVGDEPIFRPDYGISRETFAVILYRYAALTGQNDGGRGSDRQLVL